MSYTKAEQLYEGKAKKVFAIKELSLIHIS